MISRLAFFYYSTNVCIDRNAVFVDGQLRHHDNLECLNPSEKAWKLWWGSDRPTASALRARVVAKDAMAWASAKVTLL